MEVGTYLIHAETCIEIPYEELIGSLMYFMRASRPDICFAVSYLSRF